MLDNSIFATMELGGKTRLIREADAVIKIISFLNVPTMCLFRWATRCLSWVLRLCANRAPPVRRIASCARSYVCFGPVIPVRSARDRFGAWLDSVSYKQGGRARLS